MSAIPVMVVVSLGVLVLAMIVATKAKGKDNH